MKQSSFTIDDIRIEVLSRIQVSPEIFDSCDVAKLQVSEQIVRKFYDPKLLNNDSNFEHVINCVLNFLLWRSSEAINDITSDDFPSIFYSSTLVGLGRETSDSYSSPVGFVRGNIYRRFPELTASFGHFLVFLLEQLERLAESGQAGLVIDLRSASLSSVDISLCATIIPTVINFYPNLFKYVLIVDMPFLLRATASLALRTMPAEYRRLIRFIDRKQLYSRFSLDQLPTYLGGRVNRLDLSQLEPRDTISLKRFADKHAISQQTVNAACQYFNSIQS